MFCRTSDAEVDGVDEPAGESGRVDVVHAVGHAGWVCSSGRRWRGRQRRFSTALLADIHGRSARQFRLARLHLKHEPVGAARRGAHVAGERLGHRRHLAICLLLC